MKKQKIIVEIFGGCVDQVIIPKELQNVIVEVRDYDAGRIADPKEPRLREDEDGELYGFTGWEAE